MRRSRRRSDRSTGGRAVFSQGWYSGRVPEWGGAGGVKGGGPPSPFPLLSPLPPPGTPVTPPFSEGYRSANARAARALGTHSAHSADPGYGDRPPVSRFLGSRSRAFAKAGGQGAHAQCGRRPCARLGGRSGQHPCLESARSKRQQRPPTGIPNKSCNFVKPKWFQRPPIAPLFRRCSPVSQTICDVRLTAHE